MRPLRLLLITGVLLVPARAALADGGTVTGHVTFTGTPPAQKPYAVPTAFAGCGTQVSMDRLVIGKNNGVANSVIYIEGLKKALPRRRTTPWLPIRRAAAIFRT